MNSNLSTPEEPNKQRWSDYILILFAVIALLLPFIAKYYQRLDTTLLFKSIVAKQYHVSKKTLLRWVKLFCPKQLASRLIKQKRITLFEIQHYFGHPNDYPLDSKNRPIRSKANLERAFKISQSTLLRIIALSTNCKADLGMTIEEYNSMKIFPPKYAQLIFQFVKNNRSAKY